VSLLLVHQGSEIRVDVMPQGDGYSVTIDGRAHRVEGAFGSAMRVLIDGRPVEAAARRDGLDLLVELKGRAYAFRERDPRAPRLGTRRTGSDLARGEVHAPMPGLIVEILTDVGATVEAGQPVAIVEAMKMQNALTAPLKGRVEQISVAPGAAVDAGQLLLTIHPEEA
jgi:biotin carboxyl carrier protein